MVYTISLKVKLFIDLKYLCLNYHNTWQKNLDYQKGEARSCSTAKLSFPSLYFTYTREGKMALFNKLQIMSLSHPTDSAPSLIHRNRLNPSLLAAKSVLQSVNTPPQYNRRLNWTDYCRQACIIKSLQISWWTSTDELPKFITRYKWASNWKTIKKTKKGLESLR